MEIDIEIDGLTNCLVKRTTGEECDTQYRLISKTITKSEAENLIIVQTEVIRIKRKSFLKKYNEKNGWYVNWADLLDENEVYALVVEGSVDIQGLVAVAKNEDMQAVYICWMCANPQNNKEIVEQVKYVGVGGHLFASRQRNHAILDMAGL